MTPVPGSDVLLVRRAARRLGLQAAVGTAVVVALLAAVAAVVLVRGGHAADDTLLTDTVNRADDVQDPPTGIWLAVRTAGRTVTTAPIPAGLPDTAALDRVGAGGGPEMTDVRVDGREFRVRTAARTAPDGSASTVQAALDTSTRQQQLAGLLQALAVGGLVGLALAAVTGTVLARRAVRPLEAALTLQRRFVADAGHELRTPLTLLSTRAQLLRRRLRAGPGTDLRGDVDGIVRDAERLAAILDDLLLAADPRAEATEPVDVATVAAEVVAGAAPSAQQAGVRITVERGAGPATVLGSPGGLRRAVTALVDNAVRHAAAEVVVTVSATAALVVVAVTDDGPGIDAATMPRLFERFSSTGRPGGVGPRRYGLGLALVSEVVTRHGGTVTAADGPGRGAVIRFELPRLQETSQD